MTRKRFLSLLALAGVLVAPAPIATAAQPVRLFEIFVFRTLEHEGAPAMQRGLLDAQGGFAVIDPVPFTPPGPIPAEAMNKFIIPIAIWFGYDVLGPQALANFDAVLAPIEIGVQGYFTIAAGSAPKLDTGTLVNISARGVITPGGEPLIGGFIVEDRPRRVLIRGVGPTLGEHGVATPLADPLIKLYRHGEAAPFATNNDWAQADNAADIAAATLAAGTFLLPADSKDAAYLAELPPGVYTAHLGSNDDTGGTALLEIYTLP